MQAEPIATGSLRAGRCRRARSRRRLRRTHVLTDGRLATAQAGAREHHELVLPACAQLQDALRFGVTTVLDMLTMEGEREAAARRTDVSDFRSSGILATVPGGHGTEYGIPIPTVSGPEAAASFVADRAAGGANYLKIVLNGVRAATNGNPTMNAATARVGRSRARARDACRCACRKPE
jgi:hypothetical protein